MSTNLEYRARESQRKEKVGGRRAKLNEKKGRQRSRARDKKKKKKQRRHFFWKNNEKIL